MCAHASYECKPREGQTARAKYASGVAMGEITWPQAQESQSSMAQAGRPAVWVACCTMASICSTFCSSGGTPFCTNRLFSSLMPEPRFFKNLHRRSHAVRGSQIKDASPLQ